MRIRDGMAVLLVSLTTATSLCAQLTASKPALLTPHPCEGGCAIVENWREADSTGEGKSLFYYQRAKKQWKQVWVTDAGPIKEKQLIEELQDGGVRFQGEIPHPDGKSHLDRTTLTLCQAAGCIR